MQVHTNLEYTHPLLTEAIQKINNEVIAGHKMPFKVFETSREHDRHRVLMMKGKTRNPISRHLFNLENDPPLYCTAVDYVFYDGKWSWNIRNSTIQSWYVLFGNLVLDKCPELDWGGANRSSVNYCHFQLKEGIVINNLDKIPCVIP